MKWVSRAVIGLLALTGVVLAGTASTRAGPIAVQTNLDLVPCDPRGYGSIGAPGYSFALQPPVDSLAYAMPGSAATASVKAWHGEAIEADIVSATWRLVWNPRGAVDAGAQLIAVQSGYSDMVILSEQTGDPRATPIHTAVDITEAFRTLQAEHGLRYIAERIRRQPYIFCSTVEVVMRGDAA